MPNAPVSRKTMSPNGMLGMPGSGIPVETWPTTATPFASRSNAYDNAIPVTSATSAPGIGRAKRLIRKIPTMQPIPSAAVYVLTSSRFWAIETTFSMIVFPPDGMPSNAGIWPTVMVTARPMTNPVTTEAARNCERNPRRAAPATMRISPTISASAALNER